MGGGWGVAGGAARVSTNSDIFQKGRGRVAEECVGAGQMSGRSFIIAERQRPFCPPPHATPAFISFTSRAPGPVTV